MKYIIITNNPLVRDKYSDIEVEYYDISYQEVLQLVKNKIALGHKILTHPLSGSVKPKETPYKSIMISKNTVGANTPNAGANTKPVRANASNAGGNTKPVGANACGARPIDLESLEIIENAIATCEKFKERRDKWTPQVLEDFQLVDFTLIDSAIK